MQDTPPQQIPFTPDDATPAAVPTGQAVNWTASEFVAHHKSATWYGTLAAVAIVVAAIVYLLTKDVLSTAVVIIAAIVLGYYANRQPRQLPYRVDGRGVAIAEKFYAIDTFRSFSVVPEGAFASIILMPLKRFAPSITIYFSPADEEQIVSILGDQLPMTVHRADPIDSFMRRIRF